MSDARLRDLERRAQAAPDDREAQRAFAAEMRRQGIDAAVARFIGALTARMEAFRVSRGCALWPTAHRPAVSPGGRKFLRVTANGSAYCFIDVATGTILKPGTWKQPEPKRIPRGSVYNLDPLEGCGPYGVAYADGSGNYGWDGKPTRMPLGADPLGAA